MVVCSGEALMKFDDKPVMKTGNAFDEGEWGIPVSIVATQKLQ